MTRRKKKQEGWQKVGADAGRGGQLRKEDCSAPRCQGAGWKWKEAVRVVGCLREMVKLERGSENTKTDRALEREVSEITLAEGRETKMEYNAASCEDWI